MQGTVKHYVSSAQFLKHFEDFGVLISHKGRLDSTALGHKVFGKLFLLKKLIAQDHGNIVVVRVMFDRKIHP